MIQRGGALKKRSANVFDSGSLRVARWRWGTLITCLEYGQFRVPVLRLAWSHLVLRMIMERSEGNGLDGGALNAFTVEPSHCADGQMVRRTEAVFRRQRKEHARRWRDMLRPSGDDGNRMMLEPRGPCSECGAPQICAGDVHMARGYVEKQGLL